MRGQRNAYYKDRSDGSYGPADWRRKQTNQSIKTVKHSGAGVRDCVNKDGVATKAVYGWNVSKEKGFVKVVASPNQVSHKHPKVNGKDDMTRGLWTASVTFMRTGHTEVMGAIYHLPGAKKPGNLYLPALGWVLNPTAPNRGYCGTAKVRK